MENLVSVIVPAYNSGKTIEKSVRSILKSTYSTIEIIVIDDGSSKSDTLIYDGLRKISDKIRIIHQKNTGVSGARNTGINCAQGEFITFVDADDTIDPELISTLIDNCKKNQADVSVCGYREYFDETNYLSFACDTEKTLNCYEALECFLTSNDISWNVWGKLFKKSTIGDVRFKLGKKTAEDMFFVYEVLKRANKVVIDNTLLYNYIKQKDSAMADLNCEKFFDTYDLISEVYKDNLFDQKLQRAQSEFYVSKMLWFFRFISYKDKKNYYYKQIQKARICFCNNLKLKKIRYTKKQSIELFLLKYMYSFYRFLVIGIKHGEKL